MSGQQESNRHIPLILADEAKTKGSNRTELMRQISQNKEKTEKKLSNADKKIEKSENKTDISSESQISKLGNKTQESDVFKKFTATNPKDLKKSDSQKIFQNDRNKDPSAEFKIDPKTDRGKPKSTLEIKNSQSYKSFQPPFAVGNFMLPNNRKPSNNLQEKTEKLSTSQTKKKNLNLLTNRSFFFQHTKSEYKISQNSVRNFEDSVGSSAFLKTGVKHFRQGTNRNNEIHVQTHKNFVANANFEDGQNSDNTDQKNET